jgi:anti-sigma regulatory factor (Ser/Thr protein kinase)
MLQYSLYQMAADGANRTNEAQLTLHSQMADLALVPPWLETLALEYAISAKTLFAMNLCLEEVLSNIIRHGYSSEPDHPIVVRYMPVQNGCSYLVVEDQAPPFDPLAAETIPVEEPLHGARIGGLGIRLLRGFAASLNYEPTPAGNRLTIGFAAE